MMKLAPLLLLIAFTASAPHLRASDDPAGDLMAQEQARKEKLEQINRYNPFADPSVRPGSASAEPQLSEDPRIRRVQELMNSPLVQGYLDFLSSPQTRQIASEIANSPRRDWLLGAEAAWLVAFIFFRAWRLSKSKKWYAKTWTGIWTFGLFWAMGFVVIPWGVLWTFDPAPLKTLVAQFGHGS